MSQAKVIFNNGKWEGYDPDGRRVVRSQDPRRVQQLMAVNGYSDAFRGDDGAGAGSSVVQTVADSNDAQWDINQRFDFLAQLVTMIAKNRAVSLIVSGPGGLGKTHSVRETLKDNGLEDASGFDVESADRCYKFIKGYSTPKGLYRELYLNRDSVVVFDDCDDVMKDATALNLLKGALDSYDKRIINWNADMRDDDLPRSFQFSGRVIFITNMRRERINDALKTRAYFVDLSMTDQQKFDRMTTIVHSDSFMPHISDEHKQDALELIREVGHRVKEVSLRTLQAVTRIRANGGNWKPLAEYALMN